MATRLLAPLVLLLALLVARPATPATVRVTADGSGDYPTIQAALSSVSAGDTVLVGPGTYCEHLYMASTADGVTLLGTAGAESTVVDGQDVYSVPVLVCEAVGSSTRISGLTLTRGNTAQRGAGVRCEFASPVIVGCLISDSWSRSEGGGISCYGGDAQVLGCEIRGNLARDGGGVFIYGGTATLSGCTVRDNEAHGFGGSQSGGGLYVYAGSCTVEGNLFEGNTAFERGGGLFLDDSADVTLMGNVIAGNDASYHGGGFCSVSSSFAAHGNVISGNHAQSGGACVVRNPWSAPEVTTIANNIFFSNTAGDGAALVLDETMSLLSVRSNHFADSCSFEVRVAEGAAPDTLDFTGNWWGTADPDSIASRIYDCNDDPNVSACVDFSSWCTDPSCAGQVTGVPDTPEPVPFSWSRIKGMYR